MDSSSTPTPTPTPTPTSPTDDGSTVFKDKESMVDPFLVEALQNPRHRLTILRMELDIQKFLQSPDQQQLEFQHFPTSYLRLAAHRVAQHYCLQTLVQDNIFDGMGNRIIVRKTSDSRNPFVCLSEIPAKQSENNKSDKVKIAIRPRPNKNSINEANETGLKRNHLRTMEERKEEYDRARARIFSSPSSSDSDDILPQAPTDGKNLCLIREETEILINDPMRDGFTSSRVAIFRDREKDRTDPDYDRSYGRYVRNLPVNQSFGLAPFNVQKIRLPYVQYDAGFPQLGPMQRTQAPLNYSPSSTAVMSPFCAMGVNQTSRDAAYMQWPSPAMMYAHSYEQFSNAVFQAPFCQQPLSFDYSQHH